MNKYKIVICFSDKINYETYIDEGVIEENN